MHKINLVKQFFMYVDSSNDFLRFFLSAVVIILYFGVFSKLWLLSHTPMNQANYSAIPLSVMLLIICIAGSVLTTAIFVFLSRSE